MYSMNYIGKFIANFREFYNEINGATLTGAIDVVVVEQPDGSFSCSPFHVRFGKLGVLRSRFKVVDLELNGEPLNIHMKLGESGEAFFVEEIPEDELECSAHLATSPIPDSRFDELYVTPRRRNSLSAAEQLAAAHRADNQISDYAQRRYTDSQMEKPDFIKAKEYNSHKEDENQVESQEHEPMFEMEGLDDVGGPSSSWNEPSAPKTFAATRVSETQEAKEAVRKISVHNDFRPIADAPTEELPQEEGKQNGNGKKKKKTKKAGSKKKHQRKSSSSSVSSQSERAGSEARQAAPQAQVASAADINFFSDSELAAAALSDEMSNLNLLGDNRIPLALSDTAFEVHVAARHAGGGSRDGTPVQSDTEAELARGVAASGADKPAPTQSWRWGHLPEPPPRAAEAPPSPPSECVSPLEPLSSDEERGARKGVLSNMFSFMKTREESSSLGGAGVYLADLAEGQVDPDLYFPKHHNQHHHHTESSGPLRVSIGGASEEEYESGNGPSLPQSPASLDPPQLDSDDDEKILTKGYVGLYVQEESGAAAVSRAVSFEEYCSSPGDLLNSSRLLVRVGDKYVQWAAAGPLLLSLLAYRRPLPSRVLESLSSGCGVQARGVRETTPDANANKPRGYSWWSWRRSNPPDAHAQAQTLSDAGAQKGSSETETADSQPSTLELTKIEETTKVDGTSNLDETSKAEEVSESKVDEPSSTDEKDDRTTDETPTEAGEAEVETGEEQVEDVTEDDTALQAKKAVENTRSESAPHSSDSDEARAHAPSPPRRHRHSTDRFRKSLRLTSEQIASLNLKEGMNEVVFSVTTAYQGTTRCKCNLFRWRHDDKIVISDIDGTITKSDVLGHIFPLVGKDWAQSGVAQLFTKIKNNGYKLLYLSARAIGQARVTREYLRSIRQGEVSLPDGPLLLNPTSLLRAFHREVIEKKPEEFKIQCLSDIKALFPVSSNPFYAGYGNRSNDVCAYETVGIPVVRIFTINYRGELKHELTQTFQSTYTHMTNLVDQVFPPVLVEPCDDYAQTIYWREPIQPFDLCLPPIPEATAN